VERAALVLILLLAPPQTPARPTLKLDAKAAASKAHAVEPRAAVEALLRGSQGAPAASALAAIGRNVDELLVALARDPAIELPVRGRAVAALAQTPTPLARSFLYALVADPAKALAAQGKRKAAAVDGGAKTAAASGVTSDEAARTLQRRGAVSLGWIGGGAAPATLGPLLAHPDADVRADAALGLALTRLPRAAEILRARLPLETDPRVRAHIARQITVIEGALGLSPAPTVPAKQGPVRSEF
jgi:hypothetical protein